MSECMSLQFIRLIHACLVNIFPISVLSESESVAIGLVVEEDLDGAYATPKRNKLLQHQMAIRRLAHHRA